MLGRLLVTFAMALFLPALLCADDAPKWDKDVDGDWEIVSLDSGDGPREPEFKGTTTFQEGFMIHMLGDRVVKDTVKTDASKSPKELDIVSRDGDGRVFTFRGIYAVKGDELRICQGKHDTARPTEFAAKDGFGVAVFKRVKK